MIYNVMKGSTHDKSYENLVATSVGKSHVGQQCSDRTMSSRGGGGRGGWGGGDGQSLADETWSSCLLTASTTQNEGAV